MWFRELGQGDDPRLQDPYFFRRRNYRDSYAYSGLTGYFIGVLGKHHGC